MIVALHFLNEVILSHNTELSRGISRESAMEFKQKGIRQGETVLWQECEFVEGSDKNRID